MYYINKSTRKIVKIIDTHRSQIGLTFHVIYASGFTSWLDEEDFIRIFDPMLEPQPESTVKKTFDKEDTEEL